MSHTKEINTNINRSELLSNKAFVLHLLTPVPRLSKSELEALVLNAKSGDVKATEQVVKACLRLVYSMAAKCAWTENALDDRFQDGAEGLLKSFNSYDPEKGASFITHAIPWIRKYLSRSKDREKESYESLEFDEDFQSDAEHPFVTDDSDRLDLEQKWVKNDLEIILMRYPEEERTYLQNYYGLNDREPLSIPKIAQKSNVSRFHVQRVLEKGRERLRKDKAVRDLWCA